MRITGLRAMDVSSQPVSPRVPKALPLGPQNRLSGVFGSSTIPVPPASSACEHICWHTSAMVGQRLAKGSTLWW